MRVPSEATSTNLHVRFDEGEWQEGLASQVPPVTLYSTVLCPSTRLRVVSLSNDERMPFASAS